MGHIGAESIEKSKKTKDRKISSIVYSFETNLWIKALIKLVEKYEVKL
jgi:hypothetical protein